GIDARGTPCANALRHGRLQLLRGEAFRPRPAGERRGQQRAPSVDGDDHLVGGDRLAVVEVGRRDGRRVGERYHAGVEAPKHEVRERGGRALGRAGLRQEAGEATLETQGGQVDALLEELSRLRLRLATLVRVRPGHTDGPTVHDRERAPVDRV